MISAVAVVMGPSGCGKTTVAKRAAGLADAAFFEADDYHTDDARAAMAAGRGLTNAERQPWVACIGRAISGTKAPRAVLACSALNAEVRGWLRACLPGSPHFFYLHVPEAILAERLAARPGHYAGPSLLQSQLAALDTANTIRLDGTLPPTDLAARIAAAFEADA